MTEQDDLVQAARPGEPAPSPRRSRRIRRRLWAAAATVGLVVAVIALVSRLLAGPILTSLFTEGIAGRLEAALGPGSTVSIGVVGLSLGADFRPRIHLGDVLVSRPDLGTASVDTLAIDRAWYGGSGWAETVTADHVLLDVVLGARPLPTMSAIVRAFDRAVAAPPMRALDIRSLTVRRSFLASARVDVLDRAALSAALDPQSGARLALTGEGGADGWSLRMDGGVAKGGDGLTFAVETDGLSIGDVVAMAGGARPTVDGPVGFAGTVTIDEDRIDSGKGTVTLGPLLAADGSAAPLAGARTRLDVEMQPGTRVVDLIPSPVILPNGQAIVSGQVRLPDDGGSKVAFDLRLGARGRDGEDSKEAIGGLSGHYDPAEGVLAIDALRAATDGAVFNAALRIMSTRDHVSGALSGVFPRLSVDALKTLWPPMLVPDARRWVMENAESGLLTDATVDLAVLDTALGDGPDGRSASATLAFRFQDLAFESFRGGPMIRDAEGTGRLDGDRFVVALESGVVDLEDGGTLSVGPATFTVGDVRPKPPHGQVAVTLDGSAPAAVALWGRLPFGRDGRFALDPDEASGSVRADISLSLPLKAGVQPSELTYAAQVAVRDLALARPVAGRTLADADLDIAVADGRATITGDALLDGVKASIDIDQPLAPGAAATSSIALTLGPRDRERLGLDFGDAVDGPVKVSVSGGADGGAQTVVVDLTPARIRLAPLGITKAKGKPGTVRFSMTRGADRIVIDDLDLETEGASLAGSLVLDGTGRLLKADLPRISARPGDRIALTANRDGDGTLAVAVRGSRFDARRLVRTLLRGGAGTAGAGATRVDVTIDTLLGHGDEALTGVNIAAEADGGRLAALALTAQTAGSGAASMTLTPIGRTRRLEAEVGEVGRVLRFLGLYGHVEGGRAVVSGTVDASGAIRASVDGSRLRIVDEPALRRLSTAAESGPNAGLGTVDIERLLFDLSFADGVLSVEDGVVRAATAGLSLQGDVDFSRDIVRLSGTYLPASALDSLLGKIPLIGQTMFAGGRAGLLGVTFRISGPIDKPSLTVNPLSAIAPGIFRKLFELR
jgi:hypothetical protein